MIRVLHVTYGMDRGGIETFIMNVYRNIDRGAIQFDFLLHKEQADYRDEIESLGGRIYVVPSMRHDFFGKETKLFFREHASEYNAVHLHLPCITGLRELKFAKEYGIPVRILHSHSSAAELFRRKVLHYLNKSRVRKFANVCFACSDKAASWMFDYTGVRQQVKILNNAIDTSSFKFNQKTRNILRQTLGLNDDDVVVGHVGRFVLPKNHRFIVDVFEQFRKITPNSHLLLVGTGELEGEVREQIKSKGLTDRVHLLGVRSDVADLMQAFDIFLMPSLYEGLGIVLIEAQTAGLPVFCSDTIPSESRVTPNYYSISLNNTAEEWASEMKRVWGSYHRTDTSDIVKSHGFDIVRVAQYLSGVYAEGKLKAGNY